MVDVAGHLGMALLWLAPAWYLLDDHRMAAVVVGGGFWFGMLPDIDLYLSKWFAGIHHHGVVHTILVVTILAAVIGPLVGLAFRYIGRRLDWFRWRSRMYAVYVGFLTVWITGLSHLFADILSAPDASTPIEPLWPLVTGRIGTIDVLYYKSWWATWGLLILGVAANLVAWYLTDSHDRSNDSTASVE